MSGGLFVDDVDLNLGTNPTFRRGEETVHLDRLRPSDCGVPSVSVGDITVVGS